MCTQLLNALKHVSKRKHVPSSGWTNPDGAAKRPVAVCTFREQWHGKRGMAQPDDPVFNSVATPYVWS